MVISSSTPPSFQASLTLLCAPEMGLFSMNISTALNTRISTLLNTRKLLPVLLAPLAIACLAPGASAQTAYKDAQGNIYFEGLPQAAERFTVSYRAGSIKYQAVWMYKEELSRATCGVHVAWQSKTSKFILTDYLTILAAPGGDLEFNWRDLYNSTNVPYNSNPCTQPASSWRTIRPGIEALTVFKDRWSYQWRPKSGVNRGKLITSQKAARTVYIRGLPGAAYRLRNQYQIDRFTMSNACGFIKLANTEKWTAQLTDRFWLIDQADDILGTYTRSTLPLKTIAQIPKCFDGKRFMYQP